MTKAWHLRQDGVAFPVDVHLYTMEDADLASEAEVASFLIKTDSKDQKLARYVLDAWMALMIENEVDEEADSGRIDDTIKYMLEDYGPVGFQEKYVLSHEQLIQIHRENDYYHDYESLRAFVDKVTARLTELQTAIKQSINQQFCRVRFGGKYDSVAGNNGIWFRISSVGYDWNNTIYMFISSMCNQLKIDTVTVCRDAESDYAFGENKGETFYVSKDRTLYRNMPVAEFLSEEHESSPVFSSSELNSGVLHVFRNELRAGNTFSHIYSCIRKSGIEVSAYYPPRTVWKHLLGRELKKCEVLQ